MRTRGPVLTLLAVLAVGVAVFAVNTVLGPGTSTTDAATAPLAASAPADDSSGGPDAYGSDSSGAAPAAPAEAPAAAAQAPAAAAPATANTAYAGRSAGNQVTLSVGVKDGEVLAYVCDGKNVEEWLTGTMEGTSLALTGADGTTMTADTTDESVLGTVTVGGKSWPFAAQAAKSQPADPTDRAVLRKLSNA